jgi:hypothetical protein
VPGDGVAAEHQLEPLTRGFWNHRDPEEDWFAGISMPNPAGASVPLAGGGYRHGAMS